jgi:hypothetical protein
MGLEWELRIDCFEEVRERIVIEKTTPTTVMTAAATAERTSLAAVGFDVSDTPLEQSERSE